MKGKTKRILVVVVKWRHHANGPACYDHLVSIIHDSLLLNFDLGLMAERCLHSYEYPYKGLLIGCGKKWEILRHFQEKLCGKKGLLCGKLCDFFKADLADFLGLRGGNPFFCCPTGNKAWKNNKSIQIKSILLPHFNYFNLKWLI